LAYNLESHGVRHVLKHGVHMWLAQRVACSGVVEAVGVDPSPMFVAKACEFEVILQDVVAVYWS
jgi:hypothetical protein